MLVLYALLNPQIYQTDMARATSKTVCFFSQFNSQNQIKTKQKGIFEFSHVIFLLTFIFSKVYGVRNPFIKTQQGDCCCIE